MLFCCYQTRLSPEARIYLHLAHVGVYCSKFWLICAFLGGASLHCFSNRHYNIITVPCHNDAASPSTSHGCLVTVINLVCPAPSLHGPVSAPCLYLPLTLKILDRIISLYAITATTFVVPWDGQVTLCRLAETETMERQEMLNNSCA